MPTHLPYHRVVQDFKVAVVCVLEVILALPRNPLQKRELSDESKPHKAAALKRKTLLNL